MPTVCRKRDRRGQFEEGLDVELAGQVVRVRYRGRLVRTLRGKAADDVRAVIDDAEELQRRLARGISR